MSIEPYTCMVRYHHKRYYAELDYMQLQYAVFFITNVPLNVIRICFSLSIDCFQATMSGRTKGGRERGESILYARVQCIYMYK